MWETVDKKRKGKGCYKKYKFLGSSIIIFRF
jgi:stalled ribosome alternative rescue factor ArfA